MGAASPPAPMRPFGMAPDLDVDFTQADRPALVTGVLAQCCARPDPAFWWHQPVGLRTTALLHLVALTDARDDMPMHSTCTAAACEQVFSFDLPLRSLPGDAQEAGPLRVALSDGRAVTLRRPTGDDLRRWRAARPATRTEALRVMLDTLLLDGAAGPEDEAGLSAALAELDPMVDFVVACECPACGAANEVALDLETLALIRLAARQRALLLEVHRCAAHYGWTEAEVLAIPPARRAHYLALIEEER
ncbi:hypothetical protein [Pseudoduganella lutea]|uniref:Uncharacterized protein n=1 Tax=Pseudoduganella lutea TaxID=321985 RepID=A0A4P6L4H8_9BURK|nr:hypothetical protein [Pseudoduganella lutea]QBE66500.1 hypothetical protein EWM63_28955 [Pseudoduganella lutea]